MCKLMDLFKPVVPVVKTAIPYTEVWKDFSGLKNTGPEDNWYHCAEIEQIMDWCYQCRSECPSYKSNSASEQGFDCDDFAKCFAAFCRRKNLTNAVWEVWGDAAGAHAWNVCQCPDGKYEIEPQTGEVWVFKSKPSYKAELIK